MNSKMFTSQQYSPFLKTDYPSILLISKSISFISILPSGICSFTLTFNTGVFPIFFGTRALKVQWLNKTLPKFKSPSFQEYNTSKTFTPYGRILILTLSPGRKYLSQLHITIEIPTAYLFPRS